MKNKIIWALWVFTLILGVCFGSLWSSRFWPEETWWISNLLLIFPYWILIFPCALLLGIVIKIKNAPLIWANLFLVVFLFFGLMGLIFSPSSLIYQRGEKDISVLIVNLDGGRVKLKPLADYVRRANPDIVAIQEANSGMTAFFRRWLPGYNVHYDQELALLTKFPIAQAEVKNTYVLLKWGGMIGRYGLGSATGNFIFYNVHFETMRDGIDAVLSGGPAGVERLRSETSYQHVENELAYKWIDIDQPVIIGGDFNMLDSHPIYHTFWSGFTNAFKKAGLGFGYTKFTPYHGVRIDHILSNLFFKPKKCRTIKHLGSDHNAVFCTFTRTEGKVASNQKKKKISLPVENLPNYLVYANFEKGQSEFTPSNGIQVFPDTKGAYKNGVSLEAITNPQADRLELVMSDIVWKLDEYARLKFAYKIPSGLPVTLMVQTQFGDWLCLGGTDTRRCPTTEVKQPSTLMSDGQWHEFKLDTRASVRSLLPSMKTITTFKFYVGQTSFEGNQFWIDEFMIYE